MTIQIQDTGPSLCIQDNGNARYIAKPHVHGVEVIKANIIKLDIGKGPLRNLFIAYNDVTVPATANPDALRDAINAMLTESIHCNGGGQTMPTEQLDELVAITTAIQDLMGDPLMIDESNPNMIYKGYANLGAEPTANVWAIQRIINDHDIISYQWAEGKRSFDKAWEKRGTYDYE